MKKKVVVPRSSRCWTDHPAGKWPPSLLCPMLLYPTTPGKERKAEPPTRQKKEQSDSADAKATTLGHLAQGASGFVGEGLSRRAVIGPPRVRLQPRLVMAFRCAAGLNVAGADRNADGLSISCGAAVASHDRVKAIFPETIIFFPLPLNESQSVAFADDSLASRIMFSGGVILSAFVGMSLLADAAG